MMYKYVLLLKTIIQKHSHHSISKSSEFTTITEKLNDTKKSFGPQIIFLHDAGTLLPSACTSLDKQYSKLSTLCLSTQKAYPKTQMNKITFKKTKFSVAVSSKLLVYIDLKDRQNTMRLVGHQWLSLVAESKILNLYKDLLSILDNKKAGWGKDSLVKINYCFPGNLNSGLGTHFSSPLPPVTSDSWNLIPSLTSTGTPTPYTRINKIFKSPFFPPLHIQVSSICHSSNTTKIFNYLYIKFSQERYSFKLQPDQPGVVVHAFHPGPRMAEMSLVQ